MISIIIPAYNEEQVIAQTIRYLMSCNAADHITEIVVSDGGSTDHTRSVAQEAGAKVITSSKKGRAAQMNAGAAAATAPVLYFLHADTIPPQSFVTDIITALSKGYQSGCFMLAFDHAHWFLKANCWFTRFDINQFRFGDQSLFVPRNIFEQSGGFNEQLIVMEDQEIIRRLKKMVLFTIIKKPVITSARKYLVNGIYKTQGIFFIIFFMYQLGYSQSQLVSTYRKLMVQDKV